MKECANMYPTWLFQEKEHMGFSKCGACNNKKWLNYDYRPARRFLPSYNALIPELKESDSKARLPKQENKF